MSSRQGPQRAANEAGAAEFVYVGDPMCSWCWGFSPVLQRLTDRFGLGLRTIVGGLRPGPDARPLDDEFRAFLRAEWAKIAATTGQPFATSFLDRDVFLYDTEPAAIAVVTFRSLAPERTLEYFNAIQRAFYADGVDVTQPRELAALAEALDIDTTEFLAQMGAPAAKDRAWQDFTMARQLGANGFPTLFVRRDDRMAVVTHGYVPFESLEPALAAWLATPRP